MTEEKNSLRREKIKARRALSEDERTEYSSAVCRRIAGTEAFRNAKTILLYRAVGAELSLQPLAEEAERLGKRVAWPVCVGEGEMIALHPRDGKWVLGPYGIPEPDPTQSDPVPPQTIDLVICPCAAFDEACHRLGMGGGYYDRFLEKVSAVVFAAAFEAQKAERVPTEPWDRTMDAVFTESVQYGMNNTEGTQ